MSPGNGPADDPGADAAEERVVKRFGCNPFKLLGLDPKTSQVADVQKQFRKMSVLHHPDRNIGSQVAANKQQAFVTIARDSIKTAEGFRTCQQMLLDRSTGTIVLEEDAPPAETSKADNNDTLMQDCAHCAMCQQLFGEKRP